MLIKKQDQEKCLFMDLEAQMMKQRQDFVVNGKIPPPPRLAIPTLVGRANHRSPDGSRDGGGRTEQDKTGEDNIYTSKGGSRGKPP